MINGPLLKEVDIFNGLTDQQLAKVVTRCREVELNQGDVILHESEQSKEMYIIAEGEVEITVAVNQESSSLSAVDGEVQIISLGAGQTFGEMALVDQGLRSATVRCSTSPTRLIIVQSDDFMALCDEDSHLGFIVMRNIAADFCFKLRSYNLAWK